MKWCIQYANLSPFTDPDLACLLAQTAEEAGFESLMAAEHIVIPPHYESKYPFGDDGKMANNDYVSDLSVMPEPLMWMAYVAAATTRIRLTTGVMILPLRNPVVLAKQLATLDSLCRGRISIGVGVGWLREEFDAVGIPWAHRGARCDEYIAAMRTLWRRDPVGFAGKFVQFPPLNMTPKPAQPAGIPVVIGGHSNAAARRAGRLGDGFFPAIYPNSELFRQLPGLLRSMREAAADAGRDPGTIDITSGGTRRADGVKPFEDLGVHRLVIRVRGRGPAEIRDEVLRFGDEVIAKG